MTKVLDQATFRVAFALLMATILTSNLLVAVSARYLPTRSQQGADDRLDKLRELLKDLLEGDRDRKPFGAVMAPSGMEYGDPDVLMTHPLYKRSPQYFKRLPTAEAEGIVITQRGTQLRTTSPE